MHAGDHSRRRVEVVFHGVAVRRQVFLAGQLIERTRAAPEQATAVVAAGAPTTDVECFEAVRASRRGDAPFSADTPPERPPDAVEAEEEHAGENRADGEGGRGTRP